MFGTWAFCRLDENPFGPVQLYVPVTVVENRSSVSPAHIGLLLVATGVEGVWLTVTEVVAAAELQPLALATTL